MLLLAVAVLIAPLSGCRPAPSATGMLSSSILGTHLSRLIPAGTDSLAVLRQSRYVAGRFNEMDLQPVARPSYRLFLNDQPHVLGIQTGRDAQLRSRAIVVSTQLGDPGVASLLEAARILGIESGYSNIPGATVLWTVWADGTSGVSGFLNHPPWALDAVDHVLIITASTDNVAQQLRLWQEAGMAVTVVSPEHGWPEGESGLPVHAGAAYQLAKQSLEEIREIASGTSPEQHFFPMSIR